MPDHSAVDALRAEVAATARMLSAAGLVEAFGHVSARLPDGGFAITPTTPLLAVTPGDVVVVDADGVAPPGSAAPLEVPLHAAIYLARPDVAAICRGHGRSMVAWGVGTTALPLLHGLGAIAGRRVRVHPDPRLVTTPAAGEAVASTMGTDDAVLLRANGGLAVGPTLGEAATRLWFTEERAAVALAVGAASGPAGLDAPAGDPPVADDVWQARLDDTPAELRRAVAWFTTRFGDAAARTTASPSMSNASADPVPTDPRG